MAFATEPSIRRGFRSSPVYRVKGLKPLFYPHPELTAENCIALKNVIMTLEDTFEARKGYTKFNATAISESATVKVINGLYQATFKGGATRIIEVAGTKVYTDDGTTRVDITGSVVLTNGEDSRNRFVFYNDKIIGTNNVDPTYYVPSVGNAVALTGMQWTKCRDLVVHRNMLIALGTTESAGGSTVEHPTRMRWNDVDVNTFTGADITSWPTRHVFDLYEDGAPIIGAADNNGSLIVFKSDGVYPCSLEWGSGFIEMIINENGIRKGFEPVATNSIITRPEFTWVIAHDGPYIVLPDMSVQYVGQDFRKFWDDLPEARLEKAVSWIRPRDHQVRTLISSASGASGPGHDQVMVWNWRTNDFWLDQYKKPMNMGATFKVASVEYDILGDTVGFVNQGNTGTDDDGEDIGWIVTMSPNDLSLPGRTKTVLNMRSIVKSASSKKTINILATLDQGYLPPRTATSTIGASMFFDSGLSYNEGLLWLGGTTERVSTFINRTLETIAPSWTGDGTLGLVGYQVDFIQNEA